MNNETEVKKGLTTQKCSKTKMVTHTTGTFGWSALKIDVQVVQLRVCQQRRRGFQPRWFLSRIRVIGHRHNAAGSRVYVFIIYGGGYAS